MNEEASKATKDADRRWDLVKVLTGLLDFGVRIVDLITRR